MSDITLPREVAEHLTKMLEECPLIPNADWSERDCDALNALRAALAAEQPKPEPVAWRPRLSPNLCFHWSRPWSEGVPLEQTVDYWNQKGAGVEYAYAAPPDAEALRRDAEQGRWLRDWLDNNGLLIRAIRGESLAGYEHPDIEALRRENERLREAIEAYIRAKNSDGGGKGGFFPKPPTVAHQRRVHLAWQELNAALRREDV